MAADKNFRERNGKTESGQHVWRHSGRPLQNSVRRQRLDKPQPPSSPKDPIVAATQGFDETPAAGPEHPFGNIFDAENHSLSHKEAPAGNEPSEEERRSDLPPDYPTERLDDDDESTLVANPSKDKRKLTILAVLFPVAALVLVAALWQLFSIQMEYKEADNEYELLRKGISVAASPATAVSGSEGATETPPLSLESVMAMNSDCVGWLEIPNTPLSYPLVRANDNDKYLNRTFLGNTNSAGSIFMDYRNPTTLQDHHLILYGHNMKNGAMFGQLPRYLDSTYLQNNPTLTLHNTNQLYTYQIFSARITNAVDPSYQIDFNSQAELTAFAENYGAPTGTTQLLTLSTCTNVEDDERILVHAALVSVTPIS